MLGVVGWIAVAILALWRAHAALGNGSVGWDLNPLRIAGDDLRSGHSIYSNPNFVYPPPAALVGWALSFARPHTVAAVYTYCEVIAIGLTVLVLRGCLRPQRWQLAVSAVVAGLLLRGDLVNSILWLDNASVLLVLPCAFVLVRMGDGKWRSGAVVLGLTLLLKPVLLPLILVPLVLRHWRAVAETIGVVVIGLLVSVPLTNGAGSIGQVVRHLAGGSNLTGWQAVFNTSLAQFGDYHHVPTGLTILARLIVVATAGMAIVRVTRGTRNPTRPLVVALGTLLLSAVFLAGPLAENHYLILLIPGALLMVTLDDRLVLGSSSRRVGGGGVSRGVCPRVGGQRRLHASALCGHPAARLRRRGSGLHDLAGDGPLVSRRTARRTGSIGSTGVRAARVVDLHILGGVIGGPLDIYTAP